MIPLNKIVGIELQKKIPKIIDNRSDANQKTLFLQSVQLLHTNILTPTHQHTNTPTHQHTNTPTHQHTNKLNHNHHNLLASDVPL